MDDLLPDISQTDKPAITGKIDWVGMDHIDLLASIETGGIPHEVAMVANVAVDLPVPDVKGIHMSRLYRLLDDTCEQGPLTPGAIRLLLERMIASHRDCGSTRARLGLDFKLMLRRPALRTPALAGWKAYPVTLNASMMDGRFEMTLTVTITYSSTCPCSAALSRQLLVDAFIDQFLACETVSIIEASAWLRDNGTLATPHSQRSRADVSVPLEDSDGLAIVPIIECVEDALGTPVQTAVKRADEQAFAKLNGDNLMFVEDAARRVQRAMSGRFRRSIVSVSHLESLHAHDAIAVIGRTAPIDIQPRFVHEN